MERTVMKDPIFLAQKSGRATADDLDVAQELLDLSYSETQSRKRLRGDTRGTTDQNGFGEKRAVRSGFEGGDHGE